MKANISVCHVLAALVVAASACAGPAASRATSSYQGGAAAGPPPVTASAEAASDSAPSHASSGHATAHQPVREERPGLGTVWGENVTSHVDMKSFMRAATRPFAALALHYNDAEGVGAHANFVGNQQLSPVRTYTPHGGISIALTDQYGGLLAGGAAGGRTLIVGQAGARYNIVIENKTGGRFEIVASVDGLDVIDGRPADLAKRGYILEPYASLVIDGFRRSDSTVAAFRFGRVANSYAARISGDRNVGVIGVAVFAEQGSVWTSDELHRRDSANPFPGDGNYARPPGY